MSSRHNLQDATGVLLADALSQAIMMTGVTAEIPADGASGFVAGCLFLDSSTGIWYKNEGSVTSADFNLLPWLSNATAQSYQIGTRGKVGAGAGWVVSAASDVSLVGTMAASQSAGTLTIPIDGLHVGDIITGFRINAQVESAGGTVTIDADLRALTNVAADPTDASIGTMTQVSVTADTAVSQAKTGLTEVVTRGKTYYLLITATTGSSTDIQLLAPEITVTRAVGS